MPFIMREVTENLEDSPQLALIGDAYVHGIMDGEAVAHKPLMRTVNVL